MLVHRLAGRIGIAIAAVAGATQVQAQLWTVGITDAGRAYGASDNYGVALTWDWVTQSDFAAFTGTAGYAYTVCTALSPSGDYAAVEEPHRDGTLWLCEDGDCWSVGTGIVWDVDDSGDAVGCDRWINGHGVLWTDDGANRWEFPEYARIEFRSHDWAYVREQSGAYRWLERFDWNADGAVNNFDIGTFVLALLDAQRTPARNAQRAENFDIIPFVRALLR